MRGPGILREAAAAVRVIGNAGHPRERYWDRKNVHLARVNILLTSASDAQVKNAYQHHQVDIAGLGDPTGFESDPALSRALTSSASTT